MNLTSKMINAAIIAFILAIPDFAQFAIASATEQQCYNPGERSRASMLLGEERPAIRNHNS